MKTKIIIPFVASFLLLFLSTPIHAQKDSNASALEALNLINTLNLTNNSTNFYEGEVHLKNNESFKGLISINKIQNGEYSTLINLEDGCKYVPNKNIKNVVLFGKSKDQQNETVFVMLQNKRKLYRELYTKDSKNGIYDLLEKPFDWKIMSDVLIMEDNALTSVYNFWSSGPKKDIINYINKRDNKKYKRRDFKSLEKLFAAL